jgi:nicotinamide mononucleotide transporter
LNTANASDMTWFAPLLAAPFSLWGSPVSWAEIAAFVLSLAMVGCNLRVNPLGWPLAIAASLLYALVFANSKLYGEAALQGVFVVVSAWGWQQWRNPTSGHGPASAIGTLAAQARWRYLAFTVAAWPLLGALLSRATDSDVPYLDALPTVASITGQILLARKRLETWPVWLAVNLFSVGLFAYKALWLTAVLYAVFALLSVWGWRAWRAQLPR